MTSKSRSPKRNVAPRRHLHYGQSLAILIAITAVFITYWHMNNQLLWRIFSKDTFTTIALSMPKQTLNYTMLHHYVDDHEQFKWGTYQSGLYFGIRSRTYPFYVSGGLLWSSSLQDLGHIRHQSVQEDHLQQFGWLQHDGKQYGYQSILDQHHRLHLDTYYIRWERGEKLGLNGWSARIQASPFEPQEPRLRLQQQQQLTISKRRTFSLFFYIELGCEDERLEHPCRRQLQELLDVTEDPASCTDASSDWKCTHVRFLSSRTHATQDVKLAKHMEKAPLNFQLQVQLRVHPLIEHAELRYSGMKETSALNLKEKIANLGNKREEYQDEHLLLDNFIDPEATILVVQAMLSTSPDSFTANSVDLDITFDEDNDTKRKELIKPSILHQQLTAAIADRSAAFESKFESTFHLAGKQFNSSELAFAQAAFSNLVGGISYFYGRSLIQSDPTNPAIVQGNAKPLFTAVPSRSFFPRGFLWDEGFHQLGIIPFDADISRDVIAHWFGVMEDDGYIPREQILGKMARQRVPSEFLVQHVEHANPPALLLSLEKLLRQGKHDEHNLQFFKLVFPFVERWYHWLLVTQQGPDEKERATFRWRGRQFNDGKLLSNTLSSGLDDYPRASTPSNQEMHVDLLCWMIKSSDVLATIADALGYKQKNNVYLANRKRYLGALEKYHWDADAKAYFDIGEHSEDGFIEMQVAIRCRNEQGYMMDSVAPVDRIQERQVKCPPSHPIFLFPLGDGQGGLKMQYVFVPKTTKLQHVRHIGYVSIFPLLLKLLSPDSSKLKSLLTILMDPTHLWTPYGLRSLSTIDQFYEQENAPGDKPYWRGAIWININYLALDALYYYAHPAQQSPFRRDFEAAYQSLRTNVISTIYREYQRTGYLWEQYNGDPRAGQQYGKGQRCHPFSGWTALVTNIMAEIY